MKTLIGFVLMEDVKCILSTTRGGGGESQSQTKVSNVFVKYFMVFSFVLENNTLCTEDAFIKQRGLSTFL